MRLKQRLELRENNDARVLTLVLPTEAPDQEANLRDNI